MCKRSYVVEDTLEILPTDEVAQGMHLELDLMDSFFVCEAAPRIEVVGKVWSK